MGWGDVNKGALGQNSSGRILKIESGQTKTIRLLDEEPETTYVHKIEQEVNGEKVFRTIPATESLDDNIIQNGSRRWPAQPQHGMRCVEVIDGEAVGEIQVLVGGKQIYGDTGLKKLYDRYGTKDPRGLCAYDIDITRVGKERDTTYSVSMAPTHADLDLDALLAEIEQDPALSWDAIFPRVTSADQQRLLDQAGFDLSYDPAEDIAAEMTLDDAMETAISAGKYKDRLMSEIVVVDAGYISWMADNFTSDDRVAAAARVVTRNIDQIAAPTKRAALPPRSGKGAAPEPTGDTQAARPARAGSKTAPVARKATPAPEEASGPDRQALISQINDRMASDEKFEDAMEIATIVKKHGGGKTRLRDLSADQLGSLLEDLSDQTPDDPPAPARRGPAKAAAGRRR